jgi:hypothetical protein
MEKQKIKVKALITMIGTPKEHLEKILNDYIQELKTEEGVKVISEDYVGAEQKEHKNMFSAFVEVEVEFEDINKLMWFCFDYMPTSIEIITPDHLNYSAPEFSNYLNEIQSKLHKLDMLIKNFEAENQVLKKNGTVLMKNLIVAILKQKKTNLAEISKEAGVPETHITKFIDVMVKEGRVKEQDGIYELNG